MSFAKRSNFLDSTRNVSLDVNPSDVNEQNGPLPLIKVHINRVVTPDCIYVSQTSQAKSNDNLMLSMQTFYNKFESDTKNSNWQEGEICTIYSAKDKSYLRAKILNITSPEKVLVYLYDMGIEEVVTIKDIQALHPDFAKAPTYCFKVKLSGILPCGGTTNWPLLSCSTLSDLIHENERYTFYIVKTVNIFIFINIYYENSCIRYITILINYMLCHYL